MIHQAGSLREKRAASTTGSQDTEFDFDDQLISSAAYRRAFRSFMKQTGEPPRGEKIESAQISNDKPTLVETPKKPKLPKTSPKREQELTRPKHPPVSLPVRATDQTPNSLTGLGNSSPARKSKATLGTSSITRDSTEQFKLNSMLLTASSRGHVNLIKMLLANGADVNTSDSKGKTPLLLAIQGGHLDAFQCIRTGGNMQAVTKSNQTALHLACYSGNTALVELVGTFWSICISTTTDRFTATETKDSRGWCPLHYAAANGNLELIGKLTAINNRVLYHESQDGVPLHIAAFMGHVEAVEMILGLGVPIDFPNFPRSRAGGQQAIHYAAMGNQPQVVGFLLSLGVKLHVCTNDGWQAIHYAAHESAVEVIRFLHSRGISLECKAQNGTRPLHAAAKSTKLLSNC
jgi:ankyrin repeat protein